jgi:hypothetical protein
VFELQGPLCLCVARVFASLGCKCVCVFVLQ